VSTVQCNKAELAHALDVSLPTLSRWMLRYGPDFPVVQRGSNGRDYVFDFETVSRFLATKRAEEQAKRSEKDEQLAQLKLAFDVPGMPDAPQGAKASSAKDELDVWRLRKLQREEAEAAARLLPLEPTCDAVSTAWRNLSRCPYALFRQVAREQSWPESYLRDVERRLGDMQRAAVRDIQHLLTGSGEGPDDDGPDRRVA
jgi:hypothetical protein